MLNVVRTDKDEDKRLDDLHKIAVKNFLTVRSLEQKVNK